MMRWLIFGAMILGTLCLVSCGDDDGVQPDTTPPTVVSTDPADGADNVHVASSIMVTFSEEIRDSTVNDTTFVIDGVTGTISYANKMATFTPDTNLARTTPYTVRITTGVADLAGNHLASEHLFSFTTADIVIIDGDQYFPMADGDTWYYTDANSRKITRVVSGDTTITAALCKRVLEIDTTVEAWSKDSTGFYVHLLTDVYHYRFVPPLKIPFDLALEDGYDYNSNVYWLDSTAVISGTLKFKGYITDTVPAGIFDSVLTFFYIPDGYYEYYGKGVGLLDNEDYVLDSAFVGGIWYRP